MHKLADARRILVFRALQLGDLLCATPALRALRAACPQARISLMGLPWAAALAQRLPHLVDEFIEFPGYPGLPERAPDIAGFAALAQRLQAQPFDVALQMHGAGGISNPLLALLGPRRIAGYFRPGHFRPDPALCWAYPEKEHEVRRWLALLELLGMPPAGTQLEFPVRDGDRLALAAYPALAELAAGTYVCLHPGARDRGKCWPPQHFAAVADDLAGRGLKVVLTGSTKEAGLVRAVRARMRARALDSASLDLPLGALAALIHAARLLVCNDTGVSHLAAAVGVPSVVVFSATDPRIWAPLDVRRHLALGAAGAAVDVQSVIRAASSQLGAGAGPALPVAGGGKVRALKPVRRARSGSAALDVLIPTYRRPEALAITLTSLCAQSERNFRVVISDQTEDGEPLEAAEVQTPLRLLEAQGHDVLRHKHLPRRGLAEHRQFLLDQATAPHCLFLDDDLILEPDLIERLLRAIREENCGFVGSAAIGLSFRDDVRPQQQRIEFWAGPVQPEDVAPGTPVWERSQLHRAANLWHLQRALRISGERQRKYRVAWVGACVLYDTAKLRAAGGFGFWRQLPPDHAGEDALAQRRVMARYGGCAVIPSGAYHQELATTITRRDVDAPKLIGV